LARNGRDIVNEQPVIGWDQSDAAASSNSHVTTCGKHFCSIAAKSAASKSFLALSAIEDGKARREKFRASRSNPIGEHAPIERADIFSGMMRLSAVTAHALRARAGRENGRHGPVLNSAKPACAITIFGAARQD